MTGRERMQAMMRKQPFEGLSWCTLIDDATLSILPEQLRGNYGFDFYRYLGCDLFMLDGRGTPHVVKSPKRRYGEGFGEETRAEGDIWIREYTTPRGTLQAVFDQNHPVKYPVDSSETLKWYRDMWEGMTFVEHDDKTALMAIDELVGDQGIMSRRWGPSTIPMLLEIDMGTEQFYYFMADYPNEMSALIRTIHEKQIEAFRVLANGPSQVITLMENTSTHYISPGIYRQFNMPHVRDFVDIVHEAGKVAIVHMCGHIRGILEQVKQTGLDGIHGLTPPPVGDTPWEDALDVLGEDLIIVGILDPVTFCAAPLEEVGPVLDHLYTKRLRHANFCLWVSADGLAVPQERFEAVKAWMERESQ